MNDNDIIIRTMLTEFTALTSRVGERKAHQHQLILANLAASGTLLGIALGQTSTPSNYSNIVFVLVVPLLSSVLGFIWIDHELRNTEIWDYIGLDLAKSLSSMVNYPLLRWRSSFHIPNPPGRPHSIFGKAPFHLRRWSYIVGTLGTFIIPSVLSIILFLYLVPLNTWNSFIFGLGLIFTMAFLVQYVLMRIRITEQRGSYKIDYVKDIGLEKIIKTLNDEITNTTSSNE